MAKVAISTENAPKPAANYSPAVRKGNILQLAGQVPFDPKTGEIVGTTVGEQTRQVFANLEALLREAGSGWEDVVMVRAYLTDRDHFGDFNEVYNELMPEPYPARTTVYVGLAAGLLVEIDLLAVVD
ncbi:RidA family protein [Amycolatopsis endophytica]|uniref:Reactive intermediate/imine deaminase n=1 Tax=Amycolatopsis endophytica TaxID=860233 RepID=A0A853BDD0_9PSEU|nr:Rid family detoxifying hydrolase [Amycolatopsis endophytica]NYI92702.1 reactive intermediate/imine deaminase [Amycolatopsis endophytica]